MKYDDLIRVFDGYNRVARLYPALLALASLFWSAAILFPALLTSDTPRSVAVVTVALSLLYLVASIARWRGKNLEPKLISKWGGWPSTIILRHRDGHIDHLTKVRYHAALKKSCPGLTFPSMVEEIASPAEADVVYRSGTRRLIELRRDSKYRMLHAENASYGFRRNLLGLKPIGLSIALVTAIGTALLWLFDLKVPVLAARNVESWHLVLLFVLDGTYGLVWVAFVREGFVRHAGFEYAIALLRTLEHE